MEYLTWVNNLEFGVSPYPGAILVCPIPLYSGAQNDYMGKHVFL